MGAKKEVEGRWAVADAFFGTMTSLPPVSVAAISLLKNGYMVYLVLYVSERYVY